MMPSLFSRARTARRFGEQDGQMCLELAEAREEDFGERAYRFIVSHIRACGPVSGEDTTLAAKSAGIRPHDDRAFGPIYAKAIRRGEIQVVGYVLRVRGRGTSGGRLYAPGERHE